MRSRRARNCMKSDHFKGVVLVLLLIGALFGFISLKPKYERNPIALRNELSLLYGVSLKDGMSYEELEKAAEEIRRTHPITRNFKYGPVIVMGNTESPTGLVMLSHGYSGSASSMEDLAGALSQTLEHLLFVLPTAPLRHQIQKERDTPMTTAWYELKLPISTNLNDFNQDGEGVVASADYLTSLAHVIALNHSIAESRVLYAGYSQGGAVSLAAAIGARVAPAGVACLSGYLAGLNRVMFRFRHKIPAAMFHGTHDDVVPLQTAINTQHLLTAQLGMKIEFYEYPMKHNIIKEEITDLRRFIIRMLPPI